MMKDLDPYIQLWKASRMVETARQFRIHESRFKAWQLGAAGGRGPAEAPYGVPLVANLTNLDASGMLHAATGSRPRMSILIRRAAAKRAADLIARFQDAGRAGLQQFVQQTGFDYRKDLDVWRLRF